MRELRSSTRGPNLHPRGREETGHRKRPGGPDVDRRERESEGVRGTVSEEMRTHGAHTHRARGGGRGMAFCG